MQDVYSIREVSQRLSIAEQTVRKLVRENEIPNIRISPRRIIIPAKAFEEWLNDRANHA